MVKLTTIQLSEDTRRKLIKIKYDFGYKSFDETINAILSIVTKFKLGIELKNAN
jgi:hypothetical protein